MSTIAALIVAYYVLNAVTTAWVLGRGESIKVTPAYFVAALVVWSLIVWGVLSLDAR